MIVIDGRFDKKYRPCWHVLEDSNPLYRLLRRPITRREYRYAVECARKAGLHGGVHSITFHPMCYKSRRNRSKYGHFHSIQLKLNIMASPLSPWLWLPPSMPGMRINTHREKNIQGVGECHYRFCLFLVDSFAEGDHTLAKFGYITN